MKTSAFCGRFFAALFPCIPWLCISCARLPVNPVWLDDLPAVPFTVSAREVRADGRLVIDWQLEEAEPGVWRMRSGNEWAGECVCTASHSLEIIVRASAGVDGEAFRGVNLYCTDAGVIQPLRIGDDACHYRLQYRADAPSPVTLFVSTEPTPERALAALPGDPGTRRFTLRSQAEVPVQWLKISYANADLGAYDEYELGAGGTLRLSVPYQKGGSRVRMLSIVDYYPRHTTENDVYYTDDGVWTHLQLQGQGSVSYRPRLTAASWIDTDHPGAWSYVVGKRIWVTYGDYVPNQFVLYTKKNGAIGTRFTIQTMGLFL